MEKVISICAVLCMTVLAVSAQERLYPNEFPLSDVVLLEGPFKQARDLNIDVLLQYDVDRLLAPYLKESGLEPKADSYPNWSGLDGHIAGHYLSAMAINYAATGHEACGQRMKYMIDELDRCQKANTDNHPSWGTNYLGGVPESAKLWSSFSQGDFGKYFGTWAPFYNIHKMYAGLRDAWLYCGNKKAKELFINFCDWGINLCSKLSDEQMENMLRNEHGGMDEIFADAYAMTSDIKYLNAAKRFAHKALLLPMSEKQDILNNMHANTQIPKVIGFQRIGELTSNSDYLTAATYFWENVVQTRSLAFGGNSRREHFPSAEACIDYINDIDGPESCNTYNMLKLTEDLFRMRPSAEYTDFYERAMYNHILSTQHPEHGGYVYFTTARPRHYRVYSAPNEAMWCCVGTGMENHGKYNQFIYTHQGDSLFVNLFVASSLQWKEQGLALRQETDFPYSETTCITLTEAKKHFKLMLRYPGWVSAGKMQIRINGKVFEYEGNPSSYICLDRRWRKGDKIEITLPMHSYIEHLPNVSRYISILHGPILLGMTTETQSSEKYIAGNGRFGQYANFAGGLLPVNEAPIIIDDDLENIGERLRPIDNKPLHFSLDTRVLNSEGIELQPFFRIHDARYMIYWLGLSQTEYGNYIDSLARIEKEKIWIEQRTLDKIAPGEQQPETDHQMQCEKSTIGNTNHVFFRDASNGGYFSYLLDTKNSKNTSLYLRFWGVAEWGAKKFDVYIDDQKLITIDNTRRWNQSQFKVVEYDIPDSLINGKEKVRIKFQTYNNSNTGGIYEIRLLNK